MRVCALGEGGSRQSFTQGCGTRHRAGGLRLHQGSPTTGVMGAAGTARIRANPRTHTQTLTRCPTPRGQTHGALCGAPRALRGRWADTWGSLCLLGRWELGHLPARRTGERCQPACRVVPTCPGPPPAQQRRRRPRTRLPSEPALQTPAAQVARGDPRLWVGSRRVGGGEPTAPLCFASVGGGWQSGSPSFGGCGVMGGGGGRWVPLPTVGCQSPVSSCGAQRCPRGATHSQQRETDAGVAGGRCGCCHLMCCPTAAGLG